jgi:hypothetical protein
VFPVALAPEPALEPDPLRDDDVVGRYPPRFRAALPGEEESIAISFSSSFLTALRLSEGYLPYSGIYR